MLDISDDEFHWSEGDLLDLTGKPLGLAIGDTMRDFMATGLVGTYGNPDATADLYQQAMSWICYGDPGLSIGPKAK